MPSKKEILEKYFPGKTVKEAQTDAMYTNFRTLFVDPFGYSSHTKLQLPYEAPSHPVLPSREEIMQVYEERRISRRGLPRSTDRRALKIGECMVKVSPDSTLLQVSCLPRT
jgi:hypothetical protein